MIVNRRPNAKPSPEARAAKKLERETGFEPATSTLARSHSTTELLPLGSEIINYRCNQQALRHRVLRPAPSTENPPHSHSFNYGLTQFLRAFPVTTHPRRAVHEGFGRRNFRIRSGVSFRAQRSNQQFSNHLDVERSTNRSPDHRRSVDTRTIGRSCRSEIASPLRDTR